MLACDEPKLRSGILASSARLYVEHLAIFEIFGTSACALELLPPDINATHNRMSCFR